MRLLSLATVTPDPPASGAFVGELAEGAGEAGEPVVVAGSEVEGVGATSAVAKETKTVVWSAVARRSARSLDRLLSLLTT